MSAPTFVEGVARGPAGWTGLDFADAKWLPTRELGDAFIKPWSQFACYDTSAVVTDEELAAHKAALPACSATRRRFARESPARAAIRHENGTAVVTIDGRPRPAIFIAARSIR